MKKIITILSLVFSLSGIAQAPQRMSYQAVIRNSSNALVTTSSVGVQISILQGSSTGTAVYVETQLPTTNTNGLVSLEIGAGTIVTGSFSGINWANGPYFIKTETDPTGGTAYSISGTTELLSVPYALYAANSPAGIPGTNGTNGLSAYDIWLGLGNTGTQTDFINSLAGPSGAVGATGPQGSSATVTLTAGTNMSINGSSSNYTISSTPLLNLTTNTLSISGSNSVVIAPTLSLTGTTLTVGPPTNTISLPAAITPTIIGSGVLLVSQTANTFTLDVPATSIISTTGIASITSVGTNSFNVNVPAPIYNSSTGVLTTGTAVTTVAPNLALIGNVLTSGPGTNSVTINASPWTQTGGTVTTTSSTVNIGINTNIPSEKLDVNGNIRFSGALMPNNIAGTAGQLLTSAGAGATPTWTTLSSTGWALTGNAGTTPGTNFLGTTDANDLVFKSNSVEVFRAQSAGVIRMLAGADRTITMQGQTSNIDANNLIIRGSDAGIGAQARYGGALILQGGDGYNQSNPLHFGGNVVIRPGKNQYGAASYNSGSTIFQSVNSSNAYFEAARIDANGNLGIGVTTPVNKLEVAGNIVIPAANDYKYASAKTKYASVSPASFSPLSSLLVSGNNSGNARWISNGTAGVATEMFATMQFPDGAVITTLDVYGLDNDATYDISASLIAYNMSINTSINLGTTFSTSGAAFAPVTISANGLNHTVDNSTYSYYIVFNTRQNNTNLWIRGARVTYTTTKAN